MSGALSIPVSDAAEFAALPLEVRNEVRRWLRLMTPVFPPPQGCRCRVGGALRRIALDMGVSEVTARRKYDGLRNGDWRCLVNRAKAPGADSGVPAEIVREFKRRCERNQRKSKPEWRRMILEDLPAGKLSHLPWPEPGPGGIPVGCSYRNLTKQLEQFELEALRNGLGAALAEHGPQFLSTRVNLWVGSHISIDDMKQNVLVGLLGNVGATALIQELGIRDLFSADRFMTHRRPMFIREDGVRDSVKEREMRFLIAAWLRGIGYSPRGTVILSERGTAAVRRPLAAWMHEQSNGNITMGPAQHAGQAPGSSNASTDAAGATLGTRPATRRTITSSRMRPAISQARSVTTATRPSGSPALRT